MNITSNILNFLNKMKEEGIIFYCNPPVSSNLISFLSGLSKGFIFGSNLVTFEEYTCARFHSISFFGWEVNAFGPKKEMEEKGLTEEEIIQGLIDIEIETWKSLEKSNKE